MARIRLMALLLIAMLVVTACGGGSAAQPTAAPASGATNAPAAEQPTAAPAPTAAEQATVAPAPTAAEQATAAPAATAAEQPTAAAQQATTAPVAELVVDKTKLSKELHIFNWADYLDPDVLVDFQKEYGVKVIMDVYDNNEDMIAKVRPGNSGYDVVFPSDYAVDIMAREKLLEKLDKSLLPNFAHLKAENLNLYYDKDNVYSIPYNLGLTGIAYNKSKITTPPDSWAILFDPAQIKQYQGEVSMLDDSREVPGAALKYLGKSLNDTDQADLDKAKQLILDQKPFLSGYDSSNVGRNLASGQIVLAHIYNNTALQARMGLSSGDQAFAGNPDIAFVFPKEGGTIWQDNVCILSSSRNKYTAHVFLNYLMQPEVAAKNTKFNLGVTPNADAEKLLPAELQALYKEGFAPDAEVIKRAEWIERNDKTAVFDDLWTAIHS
jgi:spermidine/putrescine transport system substrate-binding protein